MNLQNAIEIAANLAYEEDAFQYVINDGDGYRVVHNEDPEAYAPGVTHRFTVYGDGVAQEHIDKGEITEDWEIPKK